MPEPHQLALFVVAGWLLNLAPGPDVLYIASNSLRTGLRAGVIASLGVAAGCLVHVTAAAIGVSALLTASAAAFTVLKFAGAAYLLWVGVRMLLSRDGPAIRNLGTPPATEQRRTLRDVFAGGFLTNVLNPKVALFFLAFVPQFIAPQASNKALAFLLLGLVFTLNSVAINAGRAVAADWLARRGSVRKSLRWLDRAAAVLFIGFGLKLAFSVSPTPSL
jgi:threonine/homoserine/homoserine lactone efflux protein